MSATATLRSTLSGLRLWGAKSLPVILQTEPAECGLACLAMVASYYGYEINLPGLRRRVSTSLKDATLGRLLEMARQLKLDSRPIHAERKQLRDLEIPCVLRWDLNHFVVLKEVSRKCIVIHDPARGMQRLSHEELSAHFGGVVVELWPSAQFTRGKVRQGVSLRELVGDVRGVKRAVIQVFLFAVALEAAMLAGPLYMQWVLDQVFPSADHELLTELGVGFLMLGLFQVAVNAMRSWCITWVGALVSVQWVNNLFAHLIRLPLEFFEQHPMGDVISRFGSVRTIQKTLTTQFVGAVLDGVMSVMTLVLMCFYSLPLTLLVAGAFALYGLFRWAIFRPLRRATEHQIVYAARQQTDLLESIRGIQAIKISNQQDHRRARYANAQVDTTNREIAVQRLGIGFHAGNGVIFGVSRVVLIWCGAALVLKGQFSAGMLVAFIAYADQFSRRAPGLIDRWSEFRMLALHAERVGEIALSSPEADLEGVHNGTLGEARLEVRGLSFHYADDEPYVIENLSLTVEPGESVAIAAPSGTGKTTLAKLVLGLLTPSTGEIRFCGVDIRKLGLAKYRGLVGAVMQNDQLFTGSVADNISLFDPDATPERVEAVAHLARIHNEISEMPMGYETPMRDMGSGLSGGQKQRVLLARALYREPRLLVLDEATSHLDVAREREINALVKRLKITRLILAHRPETLASADRVIVLGRGGMHEQTNFGVI